LFKFVFTVTTEALTLMTRFPDEPNVVCVSADDPETPRVKGVLQLTRAIGDGFLKRETLLDVYNAQHSAAVKNNDNDNDNVGDGDGDNNDNEDVGSAANANMITQVVPPTRPVPFHADFDRGITSTQQWRPYITAAPEIDHDDLDGAAFLVLASDGFFDHCSPDMAVMLIVGGASARAHADPQFRAAL
jgi:serine/threonine protein phosphatase PrpC